MTCLKLKPGKMQHSLCICGYMMSLFCLEVMHKNFLTLVELWGKQSSTQVISSRRISVNLLCRCKISDSYIGDWILLRVDRCQHDGGSRCFRNHEVSAWHYIPRDYNFNIILQHPFALCTLTWRSHSSPSLCNSVGTIIFTLQRLLLFSLYNITRFGLTGHHEVYKVSDCSKTCCSLITPFCQLHRNTYHELSCWPVASTKFPFLQNTQNSHTEHKGIKQHSNKKVRNIRNAETEYT